jgi:hypothetical protein
VGAVPGQSHLLGDPREAGTDLLEAGQAPHDLLLTRISAGKAFTAQLAAVVKNRLKRIQYRSELTGGFLAQAGLSLKVQTRSPRPWSFNFCSHRVDV